MASSGARVDSIEAVRAFKVALIKFAETANIAMGASESDLHRTLMWLTNQQTAHWTQQHRKCTELLNRAKEALREKQLYKDATKSRQSYVEEMKAVGAATRMVEEAVQKLENIRKSTRRLEKEITLYKGQVQRFVTAVALDLPNAVAQLENITRALDSYTGLREAGSEVSTVGAEATEVLPKDSPKALRRGTPRHQVRGIAPPVGKIPGEWAVKSLETWERDVLARLDPRTGVRGYEGGESKTAIDSAATISIAEGCWSSGKIYVERMQAMNANETGWYIGPADGSDAGLCQTATAGAILDARPDWKELLELPEGTLAVIDGAGIVSVLDGGDVDLWVAPRKEQA
jgi:hypothetical protein